MYPATQWTAVTRTPIAGVYEAVMGGNVAYVGSDGRHFCSDISSTCARRPT